MSLEFPGVLVVCLSALLLLAGGSLLCQWRSKRLLRLLNAKNSAYGQALQDQERLQEELLDRMGDGVVILQEANIVRVNDRLLQMGGYSQVAVLGRPFSDFLPTEDLPAMGEQYSRRLGGETLLGTSETRLIHADGSLVDVEISGGLILYKGRQADLVLVRDVSSRKRAEKQLKAYSQELELSNKRLEAAMKRAEELASKAEEANRAKNEFLSNMSHELRTPLTTIMGLCELLRDEAMGPVPASFVEPLATIEGGSQQLLDLINDILDLARLEAGREYLERRPVDVRSLCTGCLTFLQEQANLRGVALSLDCASAPLRFWADPRRLRQILINLLGNAVKFTPEGGSAGIIAAPLDSAPGVLFTVWDTGIGIDAECIATLFTPFTGASSTTDQASRGNGLGLALVSRLVRLHGGSVEVRSARGQGAQFLVSIPDAMASLNTARLPFDPYSSAATPLAGVTLLLAEDEPANADIIRLQLERRGARVDHVSDGAAALKRLELSQPDALLLDMQMPILDGPQTIQRIRKDPLRATLPIICLSAMAADFDRQQGLSVGADDYVTKPVDMALLVEKIRYLIHLRPMNSRL